MRDRGHGGTPSQEGPRRQGDAARGGPVPRQNRPAVSRFKMLKSSAVITVTVAVAVAVLALTATIASVVLSVALPVAVLIPAPVAVTILVPVSVPAATRIYIRLWPMSLRNTHPHNTMADIKIRSRTKKERALPSDSMLNKAELQCISQ